MVALLTVATFAAGLLALESLEAHTPMPWSASRPDARPNPGEDTRTAMFRHMVEAHQGSKDADDTVLWQIADLAKRRLRQVHGLGYADDPGRATELLGPLTGGPGLPRSAQPLPARPPAAALQRR